MLCDHRKQQHSWFGSRVGSDVSLSIFYHGFCYGKLDDQPVDSLLVGSPVGLKSKRFVFEILLARENRGEGTGEEGGKGEPAGNPRVFEYQPTSRPTAFDKTQSVTCQNQANHNRLKM